MNKRILYTAGLCFNLFLLGVNLANDKPLWLLSLAGSCIFLFLVIVTWNDDDSTR